MFVFYGMKRWVTQFRRGLTLVHRVGFNWFQFHGCFKFQLMLPCSRLRFAVEGKSTASREEVICELD